MSLQDLMYLNNLLGDPFGFAGTLRTMLIFFSMIAIVLGLIQALWGYKLMRLWIAIQGFFTGAVVGILFGGIASNGDGGVIAIFMLLGAVLGAMIAYNVYKVGVFIQCFGCGMLLGMLLAVMFSGGYFRFESGFMAGMVFGIVFGIIGVMVTKPMFIITTAVGGGITAGMALGNIISFSGSGFLFSILLAALGLWYQITRNNGLFEGGTGTAYKTQTVMMQPAVSQAAPAAAVPPMQNNSEIPAASQQNFGYTAPDSMTAAAVLAGAAGPAAQQAVRSIPQEDLKTSKTRTVYSGSAVKLANTEELWRTGLPVALTETVLVEQPGGQPMALYLGFQNLTEKQICAIYVDVCGYTVLKEQVAALKNVAFLDLGLGQGEIFYNTDPVLLQDVTTRRVTLTLRHVVFADDTIWDGDEEAIFARLEPQELLKTGEGGLTREQMDEFCLLAGKYKDRQAAWARRTYRYIPQACEDYWYCGCGQLNPIERESCLACGIEKEEIFQLQEPEYLDRKRGERLAEEEHQKALRAAARSRKLAEMKNAARMLVGQGKKEELLPGGGTGCTCPACGTINDLESRFCVNCGTSLEAVLNREAGLSCPVCRTPYEEGDMFCANCGAALTAGNTGNPGEIICQDCGAANPEDTMFCMTCGHLLQRSTEE